MLAEVAIEYNPRRLAGIIHCNAFGIVESGRQRQFAKPGLLAPQGRAMTCGSAHNLARFIDACRLQGQGNRFVMFAYVMPGNGMFGNAARMVALSRQKTAW